MTQVSDTDLSIIIPVYQVSEELLLRCLKSVQEIQDLRKEVILVADGPDQEVCSNCFLILQILQRHLRRMAVRIYPRATSFNHI